MGCFKYIAVRFFALNYYNLFNKKYNRAELIEFCGQGIITAPAWEKSHLDFILQWLSDDEVVFVNTSGSTGAAKTIPLSKELMRSSARLTATFFRIEEGARALLVLPSAYIAGKMVIVRALVNGWDLHWIEPTANPLCDITEEFDIASFTSMQVAEIMNECPEKFALIKTALIGGGVTSDALEQKLKTSTNKLFATYGMTETITHVAVRPLNGEKAGNYFQALPGVRFSVDARDCLVVEAAHLGGNKIATNDIVQLTSPFTFRFLGRVDNVINSGGIKLFPEKIEEKIAQLLDRSFFLIRESDENLGDRMIMYIEGDVMDDSDFLRLRSAMKLLLNSHEMPRDIRFVNLFERTDTHKVKRKNY